MIALADAARRHVLRAVCSVPAARRVFVRPELRIPAAQLGSAALAFGVAVVNPLAALWLGAALLGVPHVVSGVRHLLIRRAAYPVTLATAALGLLLGVASTLGGGNLAIRAMTLTFAVAVGAEWLSSGQPRARRLAGLAALVALTAAAVSFHVTFLALAAQLHAVSSLAFFAAAARRRGVASWPLIATALAGGAAILLGAADPLLQRFAFDLPPVAYEQLLGLTSFAPSEVVLRRALAAFAFGQSLHYAVWIRLMPEVDRPSPTPWSFRRAAAAFRADFGRLALPLAALCGVGAAAMLWAGPAARDVYFAVVYFHLGLEAAGLTRALARREGSP